MRHWEANERFFPPSVPRAAKGGIRAVSKRGSFGQNWWAKRWIAVLESLQIGGRLSRGRSYARQGQVLSIAIEKGMVTASVQGSRSEPYNVTIKVKTLTPAKWKQVTKTLSRQTIFVARLLAGDMPPEIENVFAELGLSLFPEGIRDLSTECSCPDWSNPCKHTAAVYYLLGEEFDRDPFLIFRMRGMTREELMGALAQSRFGSRGDSLHPPGATQDDEIAAPEPLSADPALFWTGTGLPDGVYGEVRVPEVNAAVVKRLGPFPFWRSSVTLADAIELIYARASELALRLFVGECKLEASKNGESGPAGDSAHRRQNQS